MILLAHRGWWKTKAEQNSAVAIERALARGFGVETDLRDLAGTVVVSHDPPRGGELTVDALLAIAQKYPTSGPLALNIKADGLQALLEPALQGRSDYFLFDMAVPDLVASLGRGFACFTRQSDIEREPVLLDTVEGVWIDSFAHSPPDLDAASAAIERGKRVAFVSPELHRRDHLDYWACLRDLAARHPSQVMLCTDLPDVAAREFGVG